MKTTPLCLIVTASIIILAVATLKSRKPTKEGLEVDYEQAGIGAAATIILLLVLIGIYSLYGSMTTPKPIKPIGVRVPYNMY